jgi:peptide/nickel transport system ATP-binding protein
MRQPLLKISNLKVEFDVFGGRLKVLDGIDLAIHQGEKVGIVGETGAGKTTTMKAVLRVLPTPPARIPQGEILFEGQDILKARGAALQRIRGRGISMIFQDPTAALNPVFSTGQQMFPVIRQAIAAGGKVSRAEVRRRALEALKDVALPDPERLLHCYPIQLSGGMRQRACIAMALSTQPKLLIADEPGTSLDVTIQDQVLRLLDQLVEQRNMTVIMITHSMGVVRERADRVYVMYAGSIAEEAVTRTLFSNPLHPYTRGLLRAAPKLTGGGVSEGIPGRMPSYLSPPSGCRFHPRCPHTLSICRVQKPALFRVGEDHRVACFLYQDQNSGHVQTMRESNHHGS